jgi:N-methylhydantoinase B/oxoprolinase/acetone carboxylase alpha subunit
MNPELVVKSHFFDHISDLILANAKKDQMIADLQAQVAAKDKQISELSNSHAPTA